MDLTDIRNALKLAIERVDGLEVDNLRANPNVPCAIVYPDTPFDFDVDFDASTWPQFIVLLLVAYTDTDSAQEQMDAYLRTEGLTSVKEAIEADQTLGGVVNEAIVTGLRSYGVLSMPDGAINYLSAELTVEIYA